MKNDTGSRQSCMKNGTCSLSHHDSTVARKRSDWEARAKDDQFEYRDSPAIFTYSLHSLT
jgi:hypothetical protein